MRGLACFRAHERLAHRPLAVRRKLGKEDGVTNLKAETFFPLTLDDAREIVRSHD
jgi:hypothetical protein